MSTFQSYNSRTKKWVKFERTGSGRPTIVDQSGSKFPRVTVKKGKSGAKKSKGKSTKKKSRKRAKIPFLRR